MFQEGFNATAYGPQLALIREKEMAALKEIYVFYREHGKMDYGWTVQNVLKTFLNPRCSEVRLSLSKTSADPLVRRPWILL